MCSWWNLLSGPVWDLLDILQIFSLNRCHAIPHIREATNHNLSYLCTCLIYIRYSVRMSYVRYLELLIRLLVLSGVRGACPTITGEPQGYDISPLNLWVDVTCSYTFVLNICDLSYRSDNCSASSDTKWHSCEIFAFFRDFLTVHDSKAFHINLCGSAASCQGLKLPTITNYSLITYYYLLVLTIADLYLQCSTY